MAFKPKLLDIVAVAVSMAVVAGFSIFAYAGTGKAAEAVIETPRGLWVYPLDQDAAVRIPGPLGETVIHVGGGRAAFVDSPCPDKLCVLSGEVSKAAQWAACLPNAVMLRIGGKSAEALDDVSF